jgi:hypothetical protein
MRTAGRFAAVSLAAAVSQALGCAGSKEPVPDAGAGCWFEKTGLDLGAVLCKWEDHPDNPLIEPEPGENLIGDPTVVVPEKSPDGRWHLFANGLLGIYHHVSSDGIAWQRLSKPLFSVGAFRPYVFPEKGVYHLLYEQFSNMNHSEMRHSTSTDLKTWSDPQTLLKPELQWETDPGWTTGNPFLTVFNGKYRLYYSANVVLLPDTNFYEPLHVGVAESSSIAGPYEKRPVPIISPDADDPLRNMGAGSIKMLGEKVGGRFIAFNNGIYRDGDGRTRSAIMVLSSPDGISWEKVCPSAIIPPGGDGWKKAFVYAFDGVRAGDEIRLYYNARDGWIPGVERIGMAGMRLSCSGP